MRWERDLSSLEVGVGVSRGLTVWEGGRGE